MHTCPPPKKALEKWLVNYPSTKSRYGHLLLEEKTSDQELIDALIPYFESAHLDAREYFHDVIGMNLHPDAGEDGYHAQYPSCLPPTAIKGLFGEVMAGLMTESFEFIGKYNWSIPVFLFRYHADAEKYLFDLARDDKSTRSVFGRFGSDFLGLAFDEDGSVVRLIAGEAKWRKKLQPATIDELLNGKWATQKNKKGKNERIKDADGNSMRDGKGIWSEINKDTPVPHGLRQLQRILKENDPDKYAMAILSMDKALSLKNPQNIPRTDLVLIVGNDVPSREERMPLIPWEESPAEYTAGNDLQVVEVVLNDGEDLIDAIYQGLWTGKN